MEIGLSMQLRSCYQDLTCTEEAAEGIFEYVKEESTDQYVKCFRLLNT